MVQGSVTTLVQLNFTANSVSRVASVIGVTQSDGNLTTTFMTAVSNDGPSVFHWERPSIANISDSNFFNNTIDLSDEPALGVFYIQFAGTRITRCVVSGNARLFYAAANWTSPFLVSDCVFSSEVPTTTYISSTGNSVRADPTSLAFKVVVPDLCARFATACPTWSVSPKPTHTVSPAKTQTETPSHTPAETGRLSQSPSSSPTPGEQTLIAVATQSKSDEAGSGGETGGSDAKNNAGGGSAGLGTAGLAGIAAAAVAVIVIVIVVLIACRKKPKDEPEPDLEEGLAATEHGPTITTETELGHDYQNPLTMASGSPQTMGQWEGDDGGND
jgi:hypothetical protein